MINPNTKIEQFTYTSTWPNGDFSDYKSSNWETTNHHNATGIAGNIPTEKPWDSLPVYGHTSFINVLLGDYPDQNYFTDVVDKEGWKWQKKSDKLSFDGEQELDRKINEALNEERQRQGKRPKKILGIMTGDISTEDKNRIISDTTKKFMSSAPDTLFEGEYVPTGKPIVRKAPITIVAGRKDNSPLRGDGIDYREQPEKAPFRVGIIPLADGRIAVCCVTALNTVHSLNDQRNGNFFAHTLIFPAGTSIEDVKAINWSAYPWQKGIPKNELYNDHKSMPRTERTLPQLSAQDILNSTRVSSSQARPQQSANTPVKPVNTPRPTQQAKNIPQQNSTTNSVAYLYRLAETSLYGPDMKTRTNANIQFAQQIKSGANIYELQAYLENQIIQELNHGKQGMDRVDRLDQMQQTIMSKTNPFNELVELALQLIELDEQMAKLQPDVDSAKLRVLKDKYTTINNQLNQRLTASDPNQIKQFVESYKKYLQLREQRETLQFGHLISPKEETALIKRALGQISYKCGLILAKQSQQEKTVPAKTQNNEQVQQRKF